jgi:hypothetical protein
MTVKLAEVLAHYVKLIKIIDEIDPEFLVRPRELRMTMHDDYSLEVARIMAGTAVSAAPPPTAPREVSISGSRCISNRI